MTVSDQEELVTAAPAAPPATPATLAGPRASREALYFARRNRKLVLGLAVVLLFLVVAVVGPLLTDHGPNEYVGPPAQRPSARYWFGTTMFGQDVFAQFTHGLRATFLVGLLGGGLAALIGMLIGFTAGYKGGVVDEALNMLTNVVLVIPTLAVLLIIATYLRVRGVVPEAVFIGVFSWPWVARAIRAQTFSLRSRDFVDLARLSGAGGPRIVFREIAPNMSSYLFMTFILLFGSSVLIAATLDFIGLGPTEGISLGLMMNNAVLWSAVSLRVEHLKVWYRTLRGDVQALDDVTFTVADGEIMGLAGESGCGKSTLGKSLIRLDGRMRHVGGTVELDGKELPIWDGAKMNGFRFKEVSIIPQYAMSAMNPTRRIGKMVEELLESRGVGVAGLRDELDRRLDLVELPREVLDRYPIELSGGMKQRMVMVISTILNPSLLIADEITSALDVSTQKAVAETLVEFRDRHYVKSTIFITHDLSLVYQIADSIIVMYAGRLAEKAPTDALVAAPRHPYTRMLLAALPEVGVRYGARRLQGIPGSPPSLLDPPTGCRFRDRCPLAFDRCVEQPPFLEVAPDHFVACWKAV
jgi:peptide/nickel transport system ATP-binding protein